MARRQAAPLRPRGHTGMLIAVATTSTMVAPLMACNCGMDDAYVNDSWGNTGSETYEGGNVDWGDGDGDGDGNSNGDQGDGDSDPGDGDGGDGEGDGDGDGDIIDACPTLPLPPSIELVAIIEVGPEQSAELPEIVAGAPPNTTILLHDGTYDLSSGPPIRLTQPGVSLRSASNDPSAVSLDGGGVLDELVVLEASHTSIAHVTLVGAKRHAIRVTGGVEADSVKTQIYDVAISNPGEQAIVIVRSDTAFYADQGEIGCSQLELDAVGRAALVGCEVAGIDARGAQGWDVHDNRLVGWWCREALAQPAIHFWQASRNTIVQRNVIENSAQGIGFGYGEFGSPDERNYVDNPCHDNPSHIGGIIRNNAIWTGDPELFASVHGVVSGISLDRACAAQVLHNSVVSLEDAAVSIAYRWPGTYATIVNNLASHGISPFAGAQGQLDGNIGDAWLDHFADPLSGNLHLRASSSAIDAGVVLEPGTVDDDIDASPRGVPTDVGADERQG
jgi:hypothetical protein